MTEFPAPKYDDNSPFYRAPMNAVHGPHLKWKPMIYTPLTKWTEHWFSFSDTPCARYENLFIQCAYQGSRKAMEKRCVKELEDFEECLMKPKQLLRSQAIAEQRIKQKKYEEVPVRDIFWEKHAK